MRFEPACTLLTTLNISLGTQHIHAYLGHCQVTTARFPPRGISPRWVRVEEKCGSRLGEVVSPLIPRYVEQVWVALPYDLSRSQALTGRAMHPGDLMLSVDPLRP